MARASRALPGEDVAAVANCLCWRAHAHAITTHAIITHASCISDARARSDTYFMMVLDTVAPRAALRDTLALSDDAHLESLLALMQRRAAAQPWGWQLPCPACGAHVHGVAADDAARREDLEAVLPVRSV